jgi:TrmH family RNA methyltransferase
VSDSELEKISNLQTANQVVIIAKQKQDVEISVANKLTIVLDAIQDPGNFGTVVRIADWFGIEQIVASENSVELYNPKVVQATMGSICRVTVVYKELLEWIKDVEIPKYGALLHGANVYTIKNIKEGLIVIGNESRGISEPLRSLITDPVTIPKAGGAESLNAAVAAGIIVGSLVNS